MRSKPLVTDDGNHFYVTSPNNLFRALRPLLERSLPGETFDRE